MAAGSRGEGESVQLAWDLPIAVLDVRLVGPEPGQEGFSSDYAIAGELRFFLHGTETLSARQSVASVVALSRGGTLMRLTRPVAADRMVFFITDVRGIRSGRTAPAALAEIEVIGQGATPSALAGRPIQVMLPQIGR
jgi:hypothetical protein